MGRGFITGGPNHRQRRALTGDSANTAIATFIAGAGIQGKRGLAAGHQQIDVCQDLGVQQCPVKVTVGVIHSITLAQGVEIVFLARVLFSWQWPVN